MNDFIDRRLQVILNKVCRPSLSYLYLANLFNRKYIPCYFSEDLLWSPIHVKNWLNNYKEYFSLEDYKKSLYTLVYYQYYILGCSEGNLLSHLNEYYMLDPETATPWKNKTLKKLISTVHNTIQNETFDNRNIPKKQNRITCNKNLLGFSFDYATPHWAR